jgi:hypothetical protein
VAASGDLDSLRVGEPGMLVEVDGDVDAMASRLRATGMTVTVNGGQLVLDGPEDLAADAVRDAAIALGVGLRRVQRRIATLEDVFLASVADA